MVISTTEKNHTGKIMIIFSQEAADTSLDLFGAMDERERVLFLKSDLCRLLQVSKMFI